jgi:hypothetical protein
MGAVRCLVVVGAVAVSLTCSGGDGTGPGQVKVPIPSGIYVVNEASNEQGTATAYAAGFDTATAYLHDVTGLAIFVPIAKILPSVTTWGQFNWTWGYVDTLVNDAVSHQKKFTIELETGFQNTTTYLQSVPAGFATACGSNCAPLFDVWTVGGAADRCVSAYILLPWVPNVQQFWNAAATALAAHLKQTGAYASLTLVHVPGLSVYDEEIRLPTGRPSPATTDTLPCPDGLPAYPTVLAEADTSNWRALGYSDSAVVHGFTTIATSFHQAFPDRFLALSLFPAGVNGIDFPNLTGDAPGTVASEIVQSVTAVAPGQVQVQADQLDIGPVLAEVPTVSAQYGDSTGWQTNRHAGPGAGCNNGGPGSCSPDGPTGPFFQLLQNGSQNHGEYIEIWSADVLAYPQGLDAAKAANLYPAR